MAMTTCKECRKAVASEAPSCPHCGVVEPGEGHVEREAAVEAARRKGDRQVKLGCGGILAVVVLIVALASLGSNDGGGETRNDDDGGVAPYSQCQAAVKRQLNNPATADFELLSTSATKTSGGWTITGKLTAKTGFGVERELTYRCMATSGGTVLGATVSE